jgi:hypothetical protein
MRQLSIVLVLKLAAVAFFLNFFWEVLHSRLYETTLSMGPAALGNLLTLQSLKDAGWIVLFYLITLAIFRNTDITRNRAQLAVFILLALMFSFVDERISIELGRWAYASVMPTVFGAGLTPFLELAVTGLVTFLVVFVVFREVPRAD